MKRLPVFLGAMALAGCAHYSRLPLPQQATLAPALPATADQALGVEAVARLAVERDPELIAARTQRGVAQAQLIEAGILPNPSLNASYMPLVSGAGSVAAWSAGLTEDVKALIVYRPRHRAARDAALQVDADLLWQEWQVAGQARQLAVELILGKRACMQLKQAYQVLDQRNGQMAQALAHGEVTLADAAPLASALQSARANLQTAEEHQLQGHHQLAALLGLQPDAPIPLADHIDLPPFDPAIVAASIDDLPHRRPDLVALRYGYAAADENLRAAILAQFPDLVFGAAGQSDSSRVVNAGPTATLGLPIFDRNQGNIALARATRAQLHADYVARLSAASGELRALLSEWRMLSGQLAVVKADLPQVRQAADQAAQAFAQSRIDARSYVDLLTAYVAKKQETMTLETALADREVAIDTLAGTGLPSVASLPPETSP